MGRVVDPAQALAVDVGVDLGRRQRAVTEQLLDRAEVGAALEQVRGERVPEPVWVPHETAQRGGLEPAAARREEERVIRARRERRPRREIEAQAVGGFLAERDDALLAALAADVDELLLEVDV